MAQLEKQVLQGLKAFQAKHQIQEQQVRQDPLEEQVIQETQENKESQEIPVQRDHLPPRPAQPGSPDAQVPPAKTPPSLDILVRQDQRVLRGLPERQELREFREFRERRRQPLAPPGRRAPPEETRLSLGLRERRVRRVQILR